MIVSRLSEVSNLPLVKIFANNDFGRAKFVLPPTVYEWENGGRGTGNHVFGTRLSEIWESYELSPRLKFGRFVGWG